LLLLSTFVSFWDKGCGCNTHQCEVYHDISF